MINKVIIIGRLGKDPEIRTTSNGSSVASFSIATTESWKDKNGEKQKKTEWHKIVVFNDKLVSGVVEKYIKKGSVVYIEGSLTTRKYTDKDGAEKYTTEVVIKNYNDTIKIISSSQKENVDGEFVEEDEVPF